MSEDAEIHAERLKSAIDLRSEGAVIPMTRRGESIGAGHFKPHDSPGTRDGPLEGANEGEFASIPAVGARALALILGVVTMILLAVLISCVAARKPEENAPAAHPERMVCLMARLQNGARAQDPAGDPCVR